MVHRRLNPQGRAYFISPIGIKTRIDHNGKHITVDQSLDNILQGWFYWQMGGQYIQDAFAFLSPSEREFLQTGIDEQTWNRIFGETE